MERDLDKNPYSKDEQRVANFFFEKGIGGGDDPIGFILVSYTWLVAERNALRSAVCIWEALKQQCASTKDKSKVKTLVSVKFADVKEAIRNIIFQ